MATCPAACNTTELLANPTASCEKQLRRKTLSRIAFYLCSTTIPDPITPGSMAPLFEDGAIVASMPLGNLVVADPTIEEIPFDDCSPSQRVINTREITFEDRNAVTVTSGSPGVTDDYFDYDFWQNKNDTQLVLNYMLIYCDGDVVIPRDRNGQPLTATLLVYLAWQKAQTQGGSATEFKKGSIIFQGDPFAMFTAKPAFNLIEEGIIL